MIVEDERHNYTRADVLRRYYKEDRPQRRTANTSGTNTSVTINNNEPFEFNVGRPGNIDFNMYIQRRVGIRDKETHLALKRDLVEHIWRNFRHNAE